MKFDKDKARAVCEAATAGPWQWFGNTNHHDVYLATTDRGRVFVMDFARWGMSGAQPRFQVALNGGDDSGVMRSIGEMAKNEAVSKPAVLFGPLYEAPYRKQFTGIGHPDARFIAESRTLLPAALQRIDALEAALARALAIADEWIALRVPGIETIADVATTDVADLRAVLDDKEADCG